MNNSVNNRQFKEGEIRWMDDIGERVGSEQRKSRPYVIIRNTYYGRLVQACPLAPATDKRKAADSSEWVRTSQSGRDSVVLLNQIGSFDPSRFGNKVGEGEVLPEQLNAIRKKLMKLFSVELDEYEI